MKAILILLLLPVLLTADENSSCILIKAQGEVEFREPYKNEWQPVAQGLILRDKTTLRSLDGSATVRDYTGNQFILPKSAQIEVNELKPLSRNDVIRLLTALELQKLPVKRNAPPKNGYVLHGAVQDSADQSVLRKYAQLEENGAGSLYKQHYYAGFIIKMHRLKNLLPEYVSADMDSALIHAYQEMEMPEHEQMLSGH